MLTGAVALAVLLLLPTAAFAQSEGGVLHLVREGENLGDISVRYGVSVDYLVRINELSDPNLLAVGQRLVIREGGAQSHVVQRGDVLSSIAAAYGMTARDLTALNGLENPDRLVVGQRLIVTPRVERTYQVAAGDSLWEIARRHEVSMDAIIAANELRDPSRLRPGQKLVIPAIGGGSDIQRIEPAMARGSRTAQSISFMWPVRGRITSKFGPRWGRMHYGLDIAAPTGTPVLAAAGGTVTYSGWAGSAGIMVTIDHGDGSQTRYLHNADTLVRVGDRVRSGQRVALVGSTGESTGPHLHLEVLIDGEKQDPLDWLPPR